jgi:hypothetical protein
VYPVASSQIASRPDERRRNPRHTASAIVYVHLGPDNGGIVINLGIDGVACQAARRLAAKKNSTFNVRLRGSGLNVELVGELVWMGATQKELGISFQNLSPSVQQDIADWIAGQEHACKTSGLADPLRPKPMPAMPGISAAREKFLAYPLSATLAMPQALPADPPSSAHADAKDSRVPAPVDSASGISGATQQPETVFPNQDGRASSDDLAPHSQGRNADSLPSPEPCQVEQPLHNQPLSVLSPIERPQQSPASMSSPAVIIRPPISPVREELPQAFSEPPSKSELWRTEKIEAIPQDRVSRPPDSLLAGTTAEKWIPPALLAAWRRGNRQHKLLLGSAAAVCLGFFVLILTLALAHIGGSVNQSGGSGSPQQPPARQSTTPPSATSASVVTPQTGPIPAPLPPPATVPPRSHRRPQPSPFANFVKTVFGFDFDKSDANPEIDEDQLRVQVWTSKSSGYYYCTDDGYYKNVQPGTFMSQGDALQSGYRSILGQFCD